MQRSRALAAPLLVLLAACGAPPRPASAPLASDPPRSAGAPPASIAGAYRTTHEIQLVCDGPQGWCAENVDDTMVVADAAGGGITAEIELIQANAHMCSFSGTLAPLPDGRDGSRQWRFHDPGEDEGPCTLTLTLDAAGHTLGLDAEGCRTYCGARASLVATFSFPPTTPPPAPPPGPPPPALP